MVQTNQLSASVPSLEFPLLSVTFGSADKFNDYIWTVTIHHVWTKNISHTLTISSPSQQLLSKLLFAIKSSLAVLLVVLHCSWEYQYRLIQKYLSYRTIVVTILFLYPTTVDRNDKTKMWLMCKLSAFTQGVLTKNIAWTLEVKIEVKSLHSHRPTIKWKDFAPSKTWCYLWRTSVEVYSE